MFLFCFGVQVIIKGF